MKIEKDSLLNYEDNIKEFIPIKETIDIWSDSKIWKIENKYLYSEWFLQEIKRLKPIMIEFVKEGYSKIICLKYNFDYTVFRRIVYLFTIYEEFTQALFNANLWNGKLGIERAKVQIRDFFVKNNKIPRYFDEKMRNIHFQIIYNKRWKHFQINSWKDMIQIALDHEFKENWRKYVFYNIKKLNSF